MPNLRFAGRCLACFLAVALGLLCRTTPSPAAEPAIPGMLQVTFQGRTVEGGPLDWNNEEVRLLGRDGRLWQFAPAEATTYRRTSAHFHAYSITELRAALSRELGDEYDLSGTSHYLVAHPRGQRDKWAERFEDLYRSFVHYCSVRGLRPADPVFPLVGIVCRDRSQFVGLAAAQGSRIGNGVEGYYSTLSNRITLYDMGDEANSPNWRTKASVLIHEATHQTAFNTGIHSRYAAPPTWVAEGLAMLFEAPGVHDSQHYPLRSDRINPYRLQAFEQAVRPRHTPNLLQSLLAGDDMFRVNPGAAYAEAWALSFYLIETQPDKYARYLKRTASLPPFHDYPAAQRTADFAAVFGNDWRMLEAQFLRFMTDLK